MIPVGDLPVPVLSAEGALPAFPDADVMEASGTDGYLVVAPPTVEDIGQYRHMDARDDALTVSYSYCKGRTAPSLKILALHGATLHGREGVAVSRDGRLFIETQQSDYALFKWGSLDPAALGALLAAERPTVQMPGRYVSLLYASYRNWYHWLIENLARVQHLDRLVGGDGLRVIVPDDLPAAHRDSLIALGIRPERLVRYDGTTRWECETLYVPSFPSQGDVLRTDSMAWLRGRILPKSAPAATGALFVSRRDAARRHILNEDSVRRVLEPHGFAFAELGGLSFAGQVELFAAARTIVGVHGAGLSNLLFAPAGGLAVELIAQREESGEDRLTLPRLYRQLAWACGLRYVSVACVGFAQYNRNWTLSDATVTNLHRILEAAVRAG